MVHALHEAQRVLQPDGILLDLRPAPVHRRVKIQSTGGFQEIDAMREDLTDDYFADRAVKQVVRDGLFKSEKYVQFICNRVMDTFEEFHAWILDFLTRNQLPGQERVLGQVEHAYHAILGKKKIIVYAPLMLRRLRKI